MKEKKEHEYLPNRFDSQCFGCGHDNHSGLKMKFISQEDSITSTVIVPEHLCGWTNTIHGGVITTILDEIMSWSAIYFLQHLVMTKKMTVDFLKQALIGTELTAEGRVQKKINRHEVVMEGFIYDLKGEICAKSVATFAMFSPKVAKRLGIIQNDNQEWILNLRKNAD